MHFCQGHCNMLDSSIWGIGRRRRIALGRLPSGGRFCWTSLLRWSSALVKGPAVGTSLPKDTLSGGCRDSACLDHSVVEFFGVLSLPAMRVLHPLGRVAADIRAPHPWGVQGIVDIAPLTLLIAPLFQDILEDPSLPAQLWHGRSPLRRGIVALVWRMGWDLNPRDACAPAGFQDRCLQPLGHPSLGKASKAKPLVPA